jgi:PII-like signaling protein
MPHEFKGDRTLLRIFIGESDRYHGRPLYEVLVEKLRAQGFPGATVLRGIAGYGAHARLHTDKVLRLSTDLPVVIEVVAETERIDGLLSELDPMIDGGLVTLEPVRVVLYRPHER